MPVRAVGRADLDEPRAGAAHDLRQAKGAADLDQLAARHDRAAPPGESIEREQHGRGVVVDDGRRLGPGQLAQQLAHNVVAFTAPPTGEIEFQGHGVAHGRARRLDGLFGQDRPTEVGVQHRARQVENPAQPRRVCRLQSIGCAAGGLLSG